MYSKSNANIHEYATHVGSKKRKVFLELLPGTVHTFRVLRINRWYLMIFPRHAWQNSAHIKRARFCIVCMARIFAACVQTIFWRPFSYAKCISCLLNASTLQVKYTARTSSHARICTILNSNEVKKLIGRVFMHRERWKSEKETATDRMGGGENRDSEDQ